MSADAPDPTSLREVLDYDPGTGVFAWAEPEASWFKTRGHWEAYLGWVEGKAPFRPTHSGGYATGRILAVELLAHRVAWAWYYGVWPTQIDHINHERTDNRIANLRQAPQKQNARNASRRVDNTSGVTGVVWQKDRKKWAAQIMVDGKAISLGRYDKFEDAVAARKAGALRFGFHPNHGNPKRRGVDL